jgi:hypothetical protein
VQEPEHTYNILISGRRAKPRCKPQSCESKQLRASHFITQVCQPPPTQQTTNLQNQSPARIRISESIGKETEANASARGITDCSAKPRRLRQSCEPRSLSLAVKASTRKVAGRRNIPRRKP